VACDEESGSKLECLLFVACVATDTVKVESHASSTAPRITTTERTVGTSVLDELACAYDKTIELNLTAVLKRYQRATSASSKSYLVNTQGATLEEARVNLQEAVALVLEANRELLRETTHGGEIIREPLKVSA